MDPAELTRALFDPTAPLPAGWPSGALGAFLLFLVPVGGGIPLGVLMARNAGVPAAMTVGLYFVSDLVLAVTAEPMLGGVRWLGRRLPLLGLIGDRLSRLTNAVGLQQEGVRGPLGLILVSFTISPTTGRAAAAAAGHGFFSGWTLAIIGDMGYFLLLMASTLWLSGVVGDDRVTIGIVLVATWALPWLIARLRRARGRAGHPRDPRGSRGNPPAAAPPGPPPAPTRAMLHSPAAESSPAPPRPSPNLRSGATPHPATRPRRSRRRARRGGR
jgi:hypothetical protein